MLIKSTGWEVDHCCWSVASGLLSLLRALGESRAREPNVIAEALLSSPFFEFWVPSGIAIYGEYFIPPNDVLWDSARLACCASVSLGGRLPLLYVSSLTRRRFSKWIILFLRHRGNCFLPGKAALSLQQGFGCQ